MEIMAKAVGRLARDGFGDPKGYKFIHENVFWTCNPVPDALLARQPKNTISFVDAATSDQDVLRRRWIPVDIDPLRPSGVSATKEEKKAAEPGEAFGCLKEYIDSVKRYMGRLRDDRLTAAVEAAWA